MTTRPKPPASSHSDSLQSDWTGEQIVRPLTAQEFDLFQAYIYREAGIHLNESKRTLLSARLHKRVRELGLPTFGAYYRRVADGDAREKVELLDRISTNETHFFRENDHFEFLKREVFPLWIKRAAAGDMRREIRVWSAACSTGQEPYTLAMTLLSQFSAHEKWHIRILGTDISTRVLRQAREAIFPLERAAEIPHHQLKRFMRRGTRSQDGKMRAGPEIRSVVSFDRLNLNDDVYSVRGPFELIFCRNVLIYFDRESRKGVIGRLLNELAPHGYFFLGRSETLSGMTERVRSMAPSVYVLAATGDPGQKRRGMS